MKKKHNKMKLYVWTGFSPDWTGGIAFALATSEARARGQIIEGFGYNPSEWGTLNVYSASKPFAAAIAGGGIN